MSKQAKPATMDHETVITDKFRTTPIAETISKITGLPTSAIVYRCAASSYWQFRVFLEGKPRKRSTKQVELLKAKDAAKVIYAEMLLSVHAGETKAKPSSAKSLEIIANSLWIKNTTRIANGELHKDTVSKDKYVYERHIKPFFANTDVKKIDTDLLDDFRTYLTNKGLKPGTQLSYMNLVMSLLKQAQIKKHIVHVPVKPKIKVEDETRGYFDDADYDKCLTDWPALIKHLVEWARRKHLDSRLQSAWNLYSKCAAFQPEKADVFRQELEAFFKVDNNAFQLTALRDLSIQDVVPALELLITAVSEGDIDVPTALRRLSVQLGRLLEGTQESPGLNLGAAVLSLMVEDRSATEARMRFDAAIPEGALAFWLQQGGSLLNHVASANRVACEVIGEWLAQETSDRQTLLEIYDTIPAKAEHSPPAC
jgi:hypothetical protein